MIKSARATAEEKFAATQKKAEEALKEKEKAQQERAELTAKLRAQRLARDAGDEDD